jgi:TonB family protein
MADHYRTATVNTDSASFVGEVFDFRNDSTLIFISYYGTSGLERFYHLNKQQDTIIQANSVEEIRNLPDWIVNMNQRKEDFDQSDFIRKNDYPLIKRLLTPIPMHDTGNPMFTIVEDQPEFPGGMNKMASFLSYFLVYPDSAQANGITGRVYVQFIVQPDGTLGQIEALKGIGYGCDEAAVYAISKLPDWKPGYQRGKPVSVKMVVPITFR